MKSFVVLSVLSFLVSSCATLFQPAVPLSQAEVKRLTTCESTDLKKVRKNLMLAGYVVTKTTDDDIVTDFKQVDGGYSGKKWVRVTAVKVDDKTVRFKVREKNQTSERIADETQETTSRSRYASRSTPSRSTTTYRTQTSNNEGDATYTDRTRSMHENLYAEVCSN